MTFKEARNWVKKDQRLDKEKKYKDKLPDHRPLNGKLTKNDSEDYLVESYDLKETMKIAQKWIKDMDEGRLDPQSFLQNVSPLAAVKLLALARSGNSEKVQLAAVQDLLDRAGYSKVQKVAMASVDPNAPKEQLISIIEGLNKKNRVIEIEDDDEEDQDKTLGAEESQQ